MLPLKLIPRDKLFPCLSSLLEAVCTSCIITPLPPICSNPNFCSGFACSYSDHLPSPRESPVMPRARAGELGIFPSQTNLIISAKHLVPCQVTQTQVCGVGIRTCLSLEKGCPRETHKAKTKRRGLSLYRLDEQHRGTPRSPRARGTAIPRSLEMGPTEPKPAL